MHKMVVFAKAMPGQVDALASWYDEQHINDLLAIPGLVTAERHAFFPIKRPDGTSESHFFLAGEGIQGDAPEVIAVQHGSSVTLLNCICREIRSPHGRRCG